MRDSVSVTDRSSADGLKMRSGGGATGLDPLLLTEFAACVIESAAISCSRALDASESPACTAFEIAEIRITAADAIVLSACVIDASPINPPPPPPLVENSNNIAHAFNPNIPAAPIGSARTGAFPEA